MARLLMALRCVVHVLVFLLAVRVCYLGLAAVARIILNVKWMQRAFRPRP